MAKLPLCSLRELDQGYRVLAQQMKLFVSSKKAEFAPQLSTAETGNKDDLFTCLVRASEQDGKLGLSDEELVAPPPRVTWFSSLISLVQIANIFGFMFAGHGSLALCGPSVSILITIFRNHRPGFICHARTSRLVSRGTKRGSRAD